MKSVLSFDQLVVQEESVIKPLGKMLQGTRWCGGCNNYQVMVDIALILDVP